MTTQPFTLPMIAVIAALPAAPAKAAGCMPSHPGAPYTIALEFEGPNVDSIISNLRLDEEQELQALDLGAGDLWYRIEAKRGGPLLIIPRAKDERSDIVLKLYDGTLRELAASDRLATSLRHRAAEGGAYYLQVSGRSDSLGLLLQIGGMPINHPRSEEAASDKRP